MIDDSNLPVINSDYSQSLQELIKYLVTSYQGIL
jgi:hypothetical protein